MATTTRKTKAERNYEANASRIESMTKVFEKTNGTATLVNYLAELLTPAQFNMAFAIEFNKVPLEIVYVDEFGNRVKENN